MARRSGRTSLANSVHFSTPEQSAPPPQPTYLPEDLHTLRTHWKWAAFSQFITTFSSLLNIPDVTANDIETDLVSGSKRVIPRVLQRLLYTLTYDRKISIENWQSALRKQYMKRDPISNPLGPEPLRERKTESREPTPDNPDGEDAQNHCGQENLDAQSQAGPSRTVSDVSRAATPDFEEGNEDNKRNVSVDWFDLPVLTKLESLHLVAEWQFQNPTRLRTLMRSDDELASWRHEPIGYDSKRNAYWLIGGDRLWIQRVPPKPAKNQKSLKRKRPAENRKKQPVEKIKSNLAKRPRTKVSAPTEYDASKRTGRGRAAKLQAKIKLDAQAKELAALNQQAARGGRHSARLSRVPSKPLARAMGTRVSARLRGTQTNEWQSIPDEWLNEPSESEHHNSSDDESMELRPMKEQVDERDGSDSELTELSDDTDDSDIKNEKSEVWDEQAVDSAIEEENDTRKKDVEAPGDFIEWETICVTLEEWEHIAERFQKATHYLEKALHKYLVNEIVPDITQVLREEERKKRLEDALTHRKRSSRIALKESEREEARLVRQRKAEEDEKMSRARRLEARRQREEEERLRREQAREQRRNEREAREMRRQTEIEPENESSKEEESGAEAKSSAPQPLNLSSNTRKSQAPRQRAKPSANGTGHKTGRTKDWELDCEICRKRGINLDDRTPMMSCGRCFKWQHIACHDQADERAGRSKRNWDVVEFICQQCRSRMFTTTEGANPNYRDPRYVPNLPRGVNLSSPYTNSIPYPAHPSHGYNAPPLPQSSSIPSLYHPANTNYAHYTHPYGDIRTGIYDRHASSSQSYIPSHSYNQPSSTISFSHYQPREGGFTTAVKPQPPYQTRQLETYDQRPHPLQHPPYSDLRSSSNQRSTVSPPTQSVWSLGTPTAGGYTTPYHSIQSNGAPKRDLQLQPSMKPGPSSPSSGFNQQSYPDTQFRYHSTT